MSKRVAFFLAALVSALVVVLGMGAGAAQADGESIFGFLFQTKKGERVAYPGVEITVKGPQGFSDKATSDKTGKWTVDVPGPGAYTVSIDTKGLPKGVNLTDESKKSLKVPVLFAQDKPVLFPLGKSTKSTRPVATLSHVRIVSTVSPFAAAIFCSTANASR